MTASNVTTNSAAEQGARPTKPWVLWTGRVLSALPILGLLFSGFMKVAQRPEVLTEFGRLGYPQSTLVGIGVVELVSVLLYAIPRTSVLGAILVTGYLGGAVATHVRLTENFVSPLVIGILAWAGLYLRDQRLRELLPLRRSA